MQKPIGNSYSENYIESTNSAVKEPEVVEVDRYSIEDYQTKFDDMVASVAKYGGFYVGRYETSLSGNEVQSKAGQAVIKDMNWYDMYTYSESYSQSGVISEMIWGCQWDAMMRFLGEEAKNSGRVSHLLEDFNYNYYSTGGTDYNSVYQKTPEDEWYVPYKDIVNNIYDLEGNVGEWTQTKFSIKDRVYRGGNIREGGSPSHLGSSTVGPYGGNGSRLSFYIE